MKPWDPEILRGPKLSEDGGLPLSLKAVKEFAKAILQQEEVREREWVRKHPQHAAEIHAKCRERQGHLRRAIRLIEACERDGPDIEEPALHLLFAGMVIGQSSLSWFAPEADRGVRNEQARRRATDAKKSIDWRSRAREAKKALDAAKAERPELLITQQKKLAAKALGISERSFANWLNGGRR